MGLHKTDERETCPLSGEVRRHACTGGCVGQGNVTCVQIGADIHCVCSDYTSLAISCLFQWDALGVDAKSLSATSSLPLQSYAQS